eukprot:5295659-Amphidinium_carterae.2
MVCLCLFDQGGNGCLQVTLQDAPVPSTWPDPPNGCNGVFWTRLHSKVPSIARFTPRDSTARLRLRVGIKSPLVVHMQHVAL